ncbi:TNF receptor-associated factor 6 [Episyrphus balteatus]|uniref:TNF receptor-associated factor 6 n=1 Tax=Episyrphus balteatus TaxID=286459 RepID=UPI0024866FDF|nr:TNF receptor-associated factor 6 [Episyrphus balteatus]
MSSSPTPLSETKHTSKPTSNERTTSTSFSSALIDDPASQVDARYECPICIHWLNEPVLTSCGHRFCKSCIESWLQNENQCCPLDNKKLSTEHDVFPDNFTRREIDQIKWKCPNSPLGCNWISSPIEVDKHLLECSYQLPSPVEKRCPFVSVNCPFMATEDGLGVGEHIRQDMQQHMNLLLEAMQKHSLAQWNPPQKTFNNGHLASALPPPPAQYANEADENLITAMYQRIVVLEQRCREQDVKIENLTKQLVAREKCDHSIDPRYSNGVIVWQISNFTSLVEQMQSNANMRFYSGECYTSPNGYKFCARINAHKREHLSLHVHLMHSENDYHLDWPFNGRLKFCMVHPKNQQLSQHDTIMSKSDFLAFHQPKERMSPRGFGFLEYAHITEIFRKGFIENDRLVIKIQINIV